MNDSDIHDLLKRESPSLSTDPRLEQRIARSLRTQTKRSWNPVWLALPATALIALLFIWPNRPTPDNAPVTHTPSLQDTPSIEFPEVSLAELNPLYSESLALREDASRTGRFLLDCLPSLALAER